jgi:hypothetical protein
MCVITTVEFGACGHLLVGKLRKCEEFELDELCPDFWIRELYTPDCCSSCIEANPIDLLIPVL